MNIDMKFRGIRAAHKAVKRLETKNLPHEEDHQEVQKLNTLVKEEKKK